jgi:hypothetical protein
MSAGMGHTIAATLRQGAILLSSSSVTVNIGNPCPISVVAQYFDTGELPQVDPSGNLSGTFDAAKGNRVVLLVEDPGEMPYDKPPLPQLIFAAPAAVTAKGDQGQWSHEAIPNAKKGHYLLIVLTKNGVVVSIVRAVFK